MSRRKYSPVSSDRPNLSRRAIVQAMAAAAVVAATGFRGASSAFAGAAAANSGAMDRFVRASEFLTSRKVDQTLAARYYAAMTKNYPQFDADVSSLLADIDASKASDIDTFLAGRQLDKRSLMTVTTIVSGWYMGTVGTDKNIELISYDEAMMYLPTRGILVVPSYGGGPNSWGEKPA